jgi:2-polyprenyl-3-methyl-5-hydroxy-6-metoxy-1,4-benzoquinol methylase
MPFSSDENRSWAIEKIKEINPEYVLDIGAGSGTYGKLIKSFNDKCIVEAVEVWEPYIKEFNLESIYNKLYLEDARSFKFTKEYDLIIFGDVLEHMSEEDALLLWTKASEYCKYGLISIPTVHFPQGAEYGNPYEVHVTEDWTVQKILSFFKGITEYQNFKYTGSFLAKFSKE